jgi:hypothetical protein
MRVLRPPPGARPRWGRRSPNSLSPLHLPPPTPPFPCPCRRNFGLALDLDTDVYELDSTTPDKFSRHLVLRLPGHAFASNLAAGQFVGAVLAASGPELTVVTAAAADGAPRERGSFVDTAVYTRNRHFRLAYSSKGGKSAALRPTGRFATAPGPGRPTPARVFQQTLLCRVDPGAKLLLMRPPFDPAAAGGLPARREALEGQVVAAGQGGGGRRVAWKSRAGDAGGGDRMDGELCAARGCGACTAARMAGGEGLTCVTCSLCACVCVQRSRRWRSRRWGLWRARRRGGAARRRAPARLPSAATTAWWPTA